MSEDVDPFETAMAALDDVQVDQEEKETSNASGETSGSEGAPESNAPPSDPFAAAMASLGDDIGQADPVDSALQVAKAEQAAPPSTVKSVEGGVNVNFLMDIKVTLTFEVGRAKMFISDLLSLGQGSVIELHRLVGEELEIFVNGQMFATGEVVVVNEKFGARITKILAPEERIQRLGPES